MNSVRNVFMAAISERNCQIRNMERYESAEYYNFAIINKTVNKKQEVFQNDCVLNYLLFFVVRHKLHDVFNPAV